MDGATMDAGCVGYIRKYRNAITLARHVMTYTSHTMLVGEGAELFAGKASVIIPMFFCQLKPP